MKTLAAPSARGLRVVVILAGLVVEQAVLYGPSLVGHKLLLPLDLLAQPRWYLPATPEYAGVRPFDFALSDEVLLFDFERRFAAAELRAGRLPLWNPEIFLGVPFVVWHSYSPFNLLYCLFPSPVTLAWLQLLRALIAGTGAYLFFRRVLAVGFWPAAVGAWCYPLAGFFVLWQGFPHTWVTACLPWVLYAADRAVRRPGGWGGPALALLTGLVLVTRPDIAGQLLVVSGLYAAWVLWDEYRPGRRLGRAATAGSAVAAAWLLGFLLAAPYLLPLAEYAGWGDRMLRRAAGQEERPPGGLYELPRVVLPEVHGATRYGTYLAGRTKNLHEGGSAAYTGLVATLLLAPLAWCSRRHRSVNAFWAVLAVAALAWTLDLPGLVTLLRAPGLNLLSHNRFTFAAGFALLALAVTGLDVLWRGETRGRRWFAVPASALVVLGLWCLERSTVLPEALGQELDAVVAAGARRPNVPDREAAERARAHYRRTQIEGAFLCGLALAGWLVVTSGRARAWLGPAAAAVAVAELLWFGYGRNPQCDPGLYYPRLPVLEYLAAAPPGRVLGVNCLPADLAMSHGLRDVRGYDSIDPRPVLDLMDLARYPASGSPIYARAQWYDPILHFRPNGTVELPPVLSLMGARYLIFRGKPAANVDLLVAAPDYWAVENPDALPRTFVPRRVEPAPAPEELKAALGRLQFDPRRVAYAEGDVAFPAECRGTAAVVHEVPTEVTVAAEMETPGLVVLGDLWYPGWHAYRDGTPVAVLRTDLALRGVLVPAGRSTVVFRYEPESLRRGFYLLGAGLVCLLSWAAAVWKFQWYRRLVPAG